MATGKAVVYVRVSTEAQDKSASPETQEADAREFASRQGWEVVGVFYDNTSGEGTLSYRMTHGGLGRALDMLRQRTATVLMSWRFDRLARDELDITRLLWELRECGVRHLASVQEGIKSTDDNIADVITLVLAGHTGRQERTATMQRTQRGLRERMESGSPLITAWPLYGYTFKTDESVKRGMSERVGYEVCDETAAVVRTIYELTAQGVSLREIARRLDNQHVPTPSQSAVANGYPMLGRGVALRWRRSTLSKILGNPAYKGTLLGKRRKYEPEKDDAGRKYYKVRWRRDDDDEKSIPISVPALVSEELWQAAQATKTRNKAESPRNNPDITSTLLRSGYAFCGMCGRRMGTTLNRHSPHHRVYKCNGASSSTHGAAHNGCAGGRFVVSSPPVDAEVWAEAKEMAKDSEKVRRMVAKRRNTGEDALVEAQRDLQWTEAQIAEAEAKKSRLMRDMEEEADDTMRRDIRARIVELNDNLTRLQARREEVTKRATNLDGWIHHYDETLARVFGVKDATNTRTWLIGDSLAILFFNQPPETQDQMLDSLDYAGKRAVLEVLGCHVNMYPTNSEYYRTTGKRWEILWDPEGDFCGHTSTVEEPAAVTAAIEEFLRSL